MSLAIQKQDQTRSTLKSAEYYHQVYCLVRTESACYDEVKHIFESAHSTDYAHGQAGTPSVASESEVQSTPSKAAVDPYAQAYSALLFASGASFFVNARSDKFQIKLKQSPRLAALCAEKASVFLFKECASEKPTTPYAQFLLGMFHYLGLGVKQNYEIAASWFREAGNNGVDFAMYKLSVCYSVGKGVEKDELASFECCLKAAQNGLAEAQRRLGWFYQDQLDQSTLGAGFGQEMLRWFQAAAEQGYPKAQYDLANCYRKIATRQGVFENFSNESMERSAAENCVAWYATASEKGHLYALNNLAACYLHGIGTPVRAKKGMILLQQAADRDCVEAIYELGKRFAVGHGVVTNHLEAKRLLRKAATEYGHIESQYALADLIASGSGAASDDAQESAAWYISAANAGLVDAMVKLAECYFTGFGVEVNHKFGAVWYRRAAEGGHATAQHRIGCCLLMGDGVDVDHSQALKWLSCAAAQSYVESYLMIGQCYELGLGVECDAFKAACWFKKAARAGSVDAQYNVACCYRDGFGLKVNESKAREYFELAASHGHKGAIEAVEGGRGTTKQPYQGFSLASACQTVL